MNAGVDVMVGDAAEFWAQKCDELCWGMNLVYKCSNRDIHSESADALPLTLMMSHVTKNNSLIFIIIINNVPLCYILHTRVGRWTINTSSSEYLAIAVIL